jgi:hypothetical protein
LAYHLTSGAIQQVGEAASAQVTLVIAIHTAITLWTRKGSDSLRYALGIIAIIVLYNLAYIGIGIGVNARKDFPYDAPSKV